MTAASGRVVGPKPAEVPIVKAARYPLAANVAPCRNWLLGIDSTGNAVAQAAGVTGLISAGFSDRDDTASATAGLAFAIGRQETVSGFPSSAGANDAPLATDIAVPAWAVDNQTVGRLSSLAGVNRSLLGILLGIDPDNNTPFFLPGPIGWLLGRLAIIADGSNGASLSKVIDAGAATDTVNGLAEAVMPRSKHHGRVTAIELTIEGTTLAASGVTNYSTLNVFKRDGAGGAAVLIGTLDTKTNVCTQWTTVSGVVSVVAGAADLLETDIVTVTKTHGGTGAIIPAGNLRLVMKVG